MARWRGLNFPTELNGGNQSLTELPSLEFAELNFAELCGKTKATCGPVLCGQNNEAFTCTAFIDINV